MQLRIQSQNINLVYCYRSPCIKETFYLEQLEDFIQTLNLNESIFIIGDLNMNYKKGSNSNISNFIENNEFVNFITEPTRINSKKNK